MEVGEENLSLAEQWITQLKKSQQNDKRKRKLTFMPRQLLLCGGYNRINCRVKEDPKEPLK